MEILNNIWMAVSTPNETLINIIAVPATIVENFLVILSFCCILKLTLDVKQKIIYIVLTSIVSLFSMNFIITPFNIITNYLMIAVVAFIILKISFFKSSIIVILSALIFNIIGSLLLNPYLTIINISSEQLSTIPIYRFFYSVILYFLVFIILFSIRKSNLKLDFLDYLDKKTKTIISINVIFGIITLIVQSIIAVYYIDILPIFITFLSFVSLVAYFIISIYSLTRIFALNSTTKKLQSAKEYNNTLRILHDNVRGFKHDFDNIVTTIGGYIKTNDMEGLKKYYVQLEDDCQRVNTLYILNPEVVNNDGIYNLITKKYYEAESKDIKVNITFLLDLGTLHMKIYEFARILGILLDNAIEASSECEEKIINLSFRNDIKNSRQLIMVENTYKDKSIDTEKIFEKGISGKENHTGLGLWEVRKLVKKNNNINLFTSKNDKFFSQQLEIYY